MKIATWNVNSLKVRLPRVLEFLELHAPDILFMQETKTEPDAFPTDALRAAHRRHPALATAGRRAALGRHRPQLPQGPRAVRPRAIARRTGVIPRKRG